MNRQKNKKRKQIMWIVIAIVLIVPLGIILFMNQPSFGRLPRGERLERILKSPNYREGKFQNLTPTEQITSGKSKGRMMLDFLFRKVEGLRPDANLPAIKTDLKHFLRDEEVLVWMGHSSFFIQTAGKRILVDPVFIMASPVSFVNKPFPGSDLYTPDDMPEIDYLIITHDHWDHLDYYTVMNLKNRTGKIICGLGVGEHFESWGFDSDQIIELDWNKNAPIGNGFTIHCLPTRHFSGRSLSPNKTLWASFMLQTPFRNIYIGGDTGYDSHFSMISKQFEKIDLAILENGQYNEDWKYIHLMPEKVVCAAKDLNAARLLTVHNSKYALGKHPWEEPLVNISAASEKDSLNLLTPMIGEVVYLNDSGQVFQKWWENALSVDE